MIAYYLTHPQVRIDADIAVTDWSLSDRGRERIEAARDAGWLKSVRRIVSSDERKALETARILAEALGLTVETRHNMGENDRSATGFITPDKFEDAADAFFASPDQSWRGWETARAAQARIVGAVNEALSSQSENEAVLFVGHGAVGTLLKCHIADRPISRSQDQPGGGGNIFAFAPADRRLVCEWTPIETFEG